MRERFLSKIPARYLLGAAALTLTVLNGCTPKEAPLTSYSKSAESQCLAQIVADHNRLTFENPVNRFIVCYVNSFPDNLK